MHFSDNFQMSLVFQSGLGTVIILKTEVYFFQHLMGSHSAGHLCKRYLWASEKRLWASNFLA